jgi:acyl-CoA synthetase (NDP forming)
VTHVQLEEPASATGGRGLFDRIMRPESVAIVGMSARANTTSNAVFRNLKINRFAGAIHLIGRTAADVDGHPIRTDIDDLPDGIDVAVLAVPSEGVGAAIAACAERNVAAAVVFASGFAEVDEHQGREQDRIGALARAGGVAVIGPNCIGYTNYLDGFAVAFANVYDVGQLPAETRDAVAVVAQSGGLGGHLRLGLQSRGISVSYSISTGNEMGLGLADFVDFLTRDAATRVITIYAEHIRQPAAFLAAAERARAAGKVIVMTHSGRGERAREAAKSHTGALAGDYAVMRALVERAGVILVETLDEVLDVSEIVARYPAPSPGGLGVMSLSGAFCGIAHDFCESIGVSIPPLAPETEAHLRPLVPSFIPPKNPLDLGTQPIWQPELLQIGLEALLQDDAIGGVAISIPAGAPPQANAFLKYIVAGKQINGKPLALAILGDAPVLSDDFLALARDNDLVLSRSSDRTLRAMGAVITWANRPASPPIAEDLPLAGLPPLRSGPQPEWAGKRVLAAVGIATPAGRLATTVEQAVAIATEIGFPVVLKAQAAALAHKTEAGGVLLGIADAAAVRAGWTTLFENVARAQPGVRLDGVLVESMAPRGLELVIGARRDPDWGPVLLVGLGGIFIEALNDARILSIDATPGEIVAELERLKTAKLLHGFRGTPALDVAAVADAAAAIGRLMRARPDIVEIDVNPLMVYPRGSGVLALDALVVTA